MIQKLWITLLHAREMQGDLCHADVAAVFTDEAAAKSFAQQAAYQLTVEVDGVPCYAQRSIVSAEVEDASGKIWIALLHARQLGGSFCHSKVEEVFADEATANDFASIKPKELLTEIDGINCFARRQIVPYDLTQE